MKPTIVTTSDRTIQGVTLFYLGTHKVHWLADPRFAEVPLFVSRRTLAGVRKLPRAVGRWALDSGGFTELQLHGGWTVTPAAYVQEVRRFRDEIGGLEWAAPQDWMCEPMMLRGGPGFRGTGLSVEDHVRRTVDNLLELRALAPDLPFAPVLQGYRIVDYWRCEDLYRGQGVDLSREPIVGIGTMCRRQSTREACSILATLGRTIALHGFGFKIEGLARSSRYLRSSDSAAWSYHARRRPPLPGHDAPGPGRRTGHKNCANCADYALAWRAKIEERLS